MQGLHAWHSNGYIHGDIKPDNVVVVKQTPQVFDSDETTGTAYFIDVSGALAVQPSTESDASTGTSSATSRTSAQTM